MSLKFRSEFEKEVFEKADSLHIFYEKDRLEYTVKHTYTPDFTIIKPDGSKIFVETKGYLRTDDIVKMRSVKRDNPELDIRMVFMKDNRISSKIKMKYSEWCKKYKFPYAFGEIPKEWLK